MPADTPEPAGNGFSEALAPQLELRCAGHLIAGGHSEYQNWEVWDTAALGRLYRLDGRSMASEADSFLCHEPLVHLAGDHLAYDLKGKLAAQGITLTPIPAYKSVAAKTLPDNVQTLLATGALDAVILMSPRSAATWVGLLSALPVKPKLTKLTHICLSQAVADKLQGLAGLTSVIAERPNADEIIIQVYRLAGPAKTG